MDYLQMGMLTSLIRKNHQLEMERMQRLIEKVDRLTEKVSRLIRYEEKREN